MSNNDYLAFAELQAVSLVANPIHLKLWFFYPVLHRRQ
jgi:hypothetical protein